MNGIAHRFWKARPRMINNPVILRELVVRLRKGSSFYYLAIFLIVGFIASLTFWYHFTKNYHRGASWSSQIREMFLILNLFQGGTVALLIPLISATIINIERERETWDLLRTTPLNLATIIVGKFFSSVLFVWVLLSSLIPIYGLFLTSGGVSPQEIGVVFLIFGEIIVVVGLIGLLCSIHCKRTVNAVSLAYFLGFIYIIGIMFIRPFICMPFTSHEHWGMEMILSPTVVAICYFANETLPREVGEFTRSHPYHVHIVMVLALIGILLYLCFKKLYQYSDRQPNQGFWTRFSRHTPAARSKGPLKDWFLPRFIPYEANPVYIKDRREHYNRRKLIISTCILFVVGLFFFLSALEINRDRDDQLHFMLIWTVFLPLTVVPYAANSIRSEFDRNTFDILATTTLTVRRIIAGKLKAGFRLFQWRLWAFFLIPFLVFLLSGGELINWYGDLLFGSIIVVYVTAYFFLSLGIYCSSLKRKTTTAYALTFGIALLLYFCLPVFSEIIIEFMRSGRSTAREMFYPLCGMLSPFFLIANYGTNSYQWDGDELWFFVFVQALWMIPGSIALQRFTRRNLMRTESS